MEHFFARLKIQLDESKKEVGLDLLDKVADLAMASNMPGQSNLLVEGVKISYSLRAEVSSVLLIFSRFSPSKAIGSETSSCTGHSGHTHLGLIGFFSTQSASSTLHMAMDLRVLWLACNHGSFPSLLLGA